jgi:hypothetical protein
MYYAFTSPLPLVAGTMTEKSTNQFYSLMWEYCNVFALLWWSLTNRVVENINND